MRRVTLITCAAWPGLSQSDSVLAEALRRLGVGVVVHPWNAEGSLSPGLGVLRAPWDYQHDLFAFLRWVNGAADQGVTLWNPPSLVRWNIDKRYLLDLSQAGVAVPFTRVLDGNADAAALVDMCEEGAVVLKPCWGGSGHGVLRASSATAADDLLRARAESPGRALLAQAYLPEIETEGEISLIFVDGRFTHAVRKRPAQGEFRVNSQYAAPPPQRITPDASLCSWAAEVLRAVPGPVPLYARIDAVPRGGDPCCLEAELIDPALYFHLAPEAAEVLANAIIQRLPA